VPDLMLATAFDERYLTPARVMIDSLVAHLPDGTRPVLHVAHSSLSPTVQEQVASLVETRFLTPSADLAATIPRHPRLPAEAAYPLLLPELLPDLERVLFLDADLLVCDDVSPLWQTCLDGRAVAAVTDAAVERCSAQRGVTDWRRLGIPAAHAYFNGGVLLIDLRAWRERDVTARTLAYLESHFDAAAFLHQGALNAVLWDDWLALDPRWNMLASVAGRRGDGAAPGIVHFAGRMKPWLGPVGGPYEAPYLRALERLGIARRPPDARRRALGLYDRLLRDTVYPFERRLWRRGWI
jgi:lipopolysaccharide biosynthesis glycosyltransferase